MPELPLEKSAYLIQFIHPDKEWAGLNEVALAPLFGVDVTTYQSIKKTFMDRAYDTATNLLNDPFFAAQVDGLPFKPGETVVGLGDSITDDYQSWIEILRHLLNLRRPQDNINIINAGISGETSAEIIGRFLFIAQQQPDWIICLVGTNDARTHGFSPTKTLVSIEETAKNLVMLRNFATTQTAARWVWMTPPTVIEDQIVTHWFLASLQMRWSNQNLEAVAEAILQMPDPVINLQTVFGNPASPELLLSDGLHPSLAGQRAIVKAVIEHFSG